MKRENKEKNEFETEDDIYVAEYSIRMTMDTLNSIRKGIENERSRAGILLGFVFLGFTQIFESLNYLFVEIRLIFFVLLCLVLYFLITSFVSKKMRDGANATKNFEENWEKKRIKFLKSYHDTLRKSVESQKKELKILSSNIKTSAILLGIIIILLFIF